MIKSASLNPSNGMTKGINSNTQTQKGDINWAFQQMMVDYSKGKQGDYTTNKTKSEKSVSQELEENVEYEVEEEENTLVTDESLEQKEDSSLELSNFFALWNQESSNINVVLKEQNVQSELEEIGMEPVLTNDTTTSLLESQSFRNETIQVDQNSLSIQEDGTLISRKEQAEGFKLQEIQSQKQENTQENIVEGIQNSEEQIGQLEAKVDNKVRKNLGEDENAENKGSDLEQMNHQGITLSTGVQENNSSVQTVETNDFNMVFVKNIEELPEQVSEQLAKGILNQQQELELQLEPANLGKIAMKISYHQGEATISLICSNSQTANILSEQAEQMGQLMEKHLGNPTEIQIDKQEATNWQEQYQEQRESQNSRQQKEEQERRYYEKLNHTNSQDFLQQLRIGLL